MKEVSVENLHTQEGQSPAVVCMKLEGEIFTFMMWNALAQSLTSLNVPIMKILLT